MTSLKTYIQVMEAIYKCGGPSNIEDFKILYNDGYRIDIEIKPIKPIEYIKFDFVVKSNNKLKLDDELFKL